MEHTCIKLFHKENQPTAVCFIIMINLFATMNLFALSYVHVQSDNGHWAFEGMMTPPIRRATEESRLPFFSNLHEKCAGALVFKSLLIF